MTANYPSTVKSWTARKDLTDLVVAYDVNSIYDEVTSIENQLGVGGVTNSLWTSYAFSTATTDWTSGSNAGLKDRLLNIEAGVRTAWDRRVNTLGGSIITPSSTSTTGLTLQAVSSQTSNLLEVKNDSSTLVAFIDKSGNFQALSIDGGTA